MTSRVSFNCLLCFFILKQTDMVLFLNGSDSADSGSEETDGSPAGAADEINQ